MIVLAGRTGAIGGWRERRELAEFVDHVRLIGEAVLGGEIGPIHFTRTGSCPQKTLHAQNAREALRRKACLRAKAADEGFRKLAEPRSNRGDGRSAVEGGNGKWDQRIESLRARKVREENEFDELEFRFERTRFEEPLAKSRANASPNLIEFDELIVSFFQRHFEERPRASIPKTDVHEAAHFLRVNHRRARAWAAEDGAVGLGDDFISHAMVSAKSVFVKIHHQIHAAARKDALECQGEIIFMIRDVLNEGRESRGAGPYGGGAHGLASISPHWLTSRIGAHDAAHT